MKTLMDDDGIAQLMHPATLARVGHALQQAGNGPKAPDAWRTAEVSLITAGRGDYLTLPIRRNALASLVEPIVAGRSSQLPQDLERRLEADLPEPVAVAARSLFSLEKLLDDIDGDAALLQKMIVIFCKSMRDHLDDIRCAIACRGATALACSAHALLSSLGVFGATHAHQLTLRLEKSGNHADFTGAVATFGALEEETSQICAALEEMLGAAG